MNLSSSNIKILLIVFACYIISNSIVYLYGNNCPTKTFYNNIFTYIEMNTQDMTVTIYDMDKNNLPLIPRKFRGCFMLEQLNDISYMLLSDPPGKNCIDNVKISKIKSDSKDIKVYINLSNAKSDYILMVKSLSTNEIYNYKYFENFNMVFPKDSIGYSISILPSSEQIISIDGISYGFHHTIKYLNIPIDDQQLFETDGDIFIDLPLFNDNIFNEWFLNGDIIILDEDKLTFHGQQFNVYENF